MAEEFGEPIAPEEGGAKSSKLWLIIVVVLILLCCCCLVGAAGVFYGIEPVMELVGIPIPW